jgi:hypothetical protein
VKDKMYESKHRKDLKSYFDKFVTRKSLIFLLHGFIGWALCGATMMIGMEVTSVENATIIHAIAAPIFFCAITFFYYQRFGYSTPLQTAIGFTAFVILMDFFIVAPIFEQSYEMFFSLLGTWIPFTLILVATFLT